MEAKPGERSRENHDRATPVSSASADQAEASTAPIFGDNHIAKLLLGLASYVPLATILMTLVYILGILDISFETGTDPETASRSISGFAGFTALATCMTFPLLFFYVWHTATRGRHGSPEGKMLWILFLIVASPFSMPLYWHQQIWTRPSRS